jgi:selenocysteine lyase/cysteine desulfurase
MTSLNIPQLRKDTPGCNHVSHFNNAGAALPPSIVLTEIKNHLDLEAHIGGYEAAQIASTAIKDFYKNAAQLIHCTPNEIAFMDNATRAWDMAFYSLNLNKGDKILTAEAEYASNYLAFLHKAQTTGVVIDVIKNDIYGQLDVSDLERKIDKNVRLIAITHVPTNGGLINPAQEVGKIAKSHNIPYLLDATQSVGQMPMNVRELQCDFLCATGRKYLRGPRGTGFLYASNKIIEHCNPPFIDLQSAQWIDDDHYRLQKNAQRFETWEQYIAGKIGLSTAIDYLLRLDINACWERILLLANLLRTRLAAIPGIVIKDLGKRQCGIITFTAQNKSPQEIQHYLGTKKINVSVSLKEYARLDMHKRNLDALVRASVHYYNTEEEIAFLCEELQKFIVNKKF